MALDFSLTTRQLLFAMDGVADATLPVLPALNLPPQSQASLLRGSHLRYTIAMLPFEFMIFATPLSQASSNAKRGGPWQTKVHATAAANWGGLPPTAGQLAVSITHLFDRFDPAGQQPDIDNIAKPIVDALEGLVYDDDYIVTDVLCRRRSLDGDLEIQQPSQLLLGSLAANREFVHVLIDDAPIREEHL